MKKQSQDRRIILGITGSFGSGKTTVAEIFKSYGAKIIDADKIAHTLIRPAGGELYQKIVAVFGRGILKKNKSIDRNKLAQKVFLHAPLLKKLNKIVHPQVIAAIKKQIKASKAKVVVLDAPLLIEAGLRKIIDKLIVVKISRRKQMQRLFRRSSLGRKEILARIKAQIPLGIKVRLADFVIDNNGSVEKTRKQLKEIRRMLWKN